MHICVYIYIYIYIIHIKTPHAPRASTDAPARAHVCRARLHRYSARPLLTRETLSQRASLKGVGREKLRPGLRISFSPSRGTPAGAREASAAQSLLVTPRKPFPRPSAAASSAASSTQQA